MDGDRREAVGLKSNASMSRGHVAPGNSVAVAAAVSVAVDVAFPSSIVVLKRTKGSGWQSAKDRIGPSAKVVGGGGFLRAGPTM
jgi:hypothetical protein